MEGWGSGETRGRGEGEMGEKRNGCSIMGKASVCVPEDRGLATWKSY